MREIAIDGACGPWSTAATRRPRAGRDCAGVGSSPRSISQIMCGKLDPADQLLDRIAAHRDRAGLDVDDRRRPPGARAGQPLLCGLAASYRRPRARRRRSRRRCSRASAAPRRCARPAPAAARRRRDRRRTLNPVRATVSGRSTPGTSSKVFSRPRCADLRQRQRLRHRQHAAGGNADLGEQQASHSAQGRVRERCLELARQLGAVALARSRAGRSAGRWPVPRSPSALDAAPRTAPACWRRCSAGRPSPGRRPTARP